MRLVDLNYKLVMLEFSPRIRKLSMHDLEFSRKIEDIFRRIVSLDTNYKRKKRIGLGEESSEKNKNFLPALTFVKTPLLIKDREKQKTETRSLMKDQKRRKIKHLNHVSIEFEREIFVSKKNDERNKERFKRILKLTQNMISKDDLRGWSRN